MSEEKFGDLLDELQLALLETISAAEELESSEKNMKRLKILNNISRVYSEYFVYGELR